MSPAFIKRSKQEQIEHFWSLVQKTDSCWLWTGRKNRQGYGTVRYPDFLGARTVTSAHRMSFALAHGSEPEGLFLCHTCDVPLCVRPDHLFPGTAKDNTLDAIKKGRRVIIAGGMCRKGHVIASEADIQRQPGCPDGRCRKCVAERMHATWVAKAALKGPSKTTKLDARGGVCTRGHDVTQPGALLVWRGIRRCAQCRRSSYKDYRRKVEAMRGSEG